ncbi:L-fucose:H+ symporter permease [Botrimarina hoheduenensis]|uniref:L-fucose-proton symporter n=1 Tax=Botrimarina hoheduenensis TaxID=2528000 RepID=A0A5C5W9L0_9BACT|nr:L-fucose:H+ symporter permease [Botrimarina hoheduenensis]TWT47556.1 L-fucose-proton symporter [Botrimarina hoheduenensis]
MTVALVTQADSAATAAGTAPAADVSRVVPGVYVAPFVLVTTLFALWGFANDITNPMVNAFKDVLLISNFESSLVQAAFYGGYCVMAIPAALFIHRYGYKSGVLMGLGLYALGCLLFLPAGQLVQFWAFLAAYFVMTSGLAFLETTANPYILAMGSPETASRRLNFAQAFNPVGSLMGMFVARNLILQQLDPADTSTRQALAQSDTAAFAALQQSDLSVISGPYLVLGLVVLAALVAFTLARLPEGESFSTGEAGIGKTFSRLSVNARYLGGVVAQAFYVGAQIMCWTFIIQYGVSELGLEPEKAQTYNIVAMVTFVVSRGVCTYLLKFFDPGSLLGLLAVVGATLLVGTITLGGYPGLYCLVAVSACMSLMFPTIYGIALEGLGDDAKLASAGLICAIGGGCIMPPLQASIMDGNAWALGGGELSAMRASFVLPLGCFLVVAIYGFAVYLADHRNRQRGY